MTKNKFLLIILVFFSTISIGQEYNTNFGLQFKPIIPVKALNVTDLILSSDRVNATLSPQLGFNFGAVIRWQFMEKLALETGLSYNKRNFKLDAILDDSATGSLNYGIITYEVPIQALFYVRLSKQFYMNVSTGFSVNFRASNVGKSTDDLSIAQITYVKNINLAYVANIGFEYRSKNSGNFYLGASLTNPFRPLGEIHVKGNIPSNYEKVIGDLSGNYISIDLRYFFNEKKKKSDKK